MCVLQDDIIAATMNGSHRKAAFSEKFPPEYNFSAKMQSLQYIYWKIRYFLDGNSAGFTQYGSRRIIMTHATNVYEGPEHG